jgi:hypothetical protein
LARPGVWSSPPEPDEPEELEELVNASIRRKSRNNLKK